jgi:hypothetical protein
MLSVDCSDGLVMLLLMLLLRKMLLLLMLVMLKNCRVCGWGNGCDSGDGGRQLGLNR